MSDPVQDIIQEPESALPAVQLSELPQSIQTAAQHAGWRQLSPVQSKGIPYQLAGRDLMVQARTGSGKTGAFLLPMLETLDASKKVPQALVLVPTRELAQQVTNDAETLFKGSGLEVVSVYGGVSYKPQIDGFKRGVQLVVGTPGRVLDHLIKRNLKLDDLRVLIFDEADRMLGMGFYPDMVDVQRYLPKERHGYMFSATFPQTVQSLAARFLDEPDFLSLSRDHVHVTDVEHIFVVTPRMDKDRSLVRLFEIENPLQALIFCNTKAQVSYVATVLKRFGYNADELSSDLSQNARERVLDRLRDGTLRFLVATDVAARGIDVPDLSHVFIYEPPEDPEIYIHRAGRTGRAGAGGSAITLIRNLEKREITRISAMYKIDFKEQPVPTDEDVSNIVAQRLTAHLEGQLRNRDKLKAERMQRFLPYVEELSETEEGRALIAMVLDDLYHQVVHKSGAPTEDSQSRGDQQKSGSQPGGRNKRGR
jgi:ATP-dependent RNA helicase DeaD